MQLENDEVTRASFLIALIEGGVISRKESVPGEIPATLMAYACSLPDRDCLLTLTKWHHMTAVPRNNEMIERFLRWAREGRPTITDEVMDRVWVAARALDDLVGVTRKEVGHG